MKLFEYFTGFLIFLYSLMQIPLSSSQRSCRNANASFIQDSIVNVTTTYSTELFSGGVNLFVTVTWSIKKDDDFELDGVLVRLRESQSAFGENVILPTDTCNPENDFYVTTTSLSSCKLLPNCNPTTTTTGATTCICDTDNCDVTPDLGCRGLRSMIALNFISVPANSGTLKYQIAFHQEYRLEMHAYYRNVVSFSPINVNVENPSGCIELVETNNNKTNTEAAQICCEAGILHTTARNISFVVGYPNLQNDTVNGTVLWLPPITRSGLLEMKFGISSNDATTVPTTGVVERYLLNLTDVSNNQCDVIRYGYRVAVGELIPEVSYQVTIRARYNNTNCPTTNCIRNEIITPEIDSCDPMFHLCDLNANCTRQSLPTTIGVSLNVTCTCTSGYQGNGYTNLSAVLGTGCQEINSCADPNLCHQNAQCIDNKAPSVGFSCRCLDGYYGNGFDCNSSLVLGIAIAVPLFVILILVLVIGAWKYRIYRIRQNELTWTQFLANKDLVIQNFLEDYHKQIKTASTFGDKWELDRNHIDLTGVIGRGNSGIVHKGVYTPNTNPTLDVKETVAVKQPKDGPDDGQQLLDFMSEISFMLNIGSHPNVLGVVGCCTKEKPVLLVTEYLKYGDLRHFLLDSREPSKSLNDPAYHVTEKSLCQMARQVALGMEYLTKTRIIHGDLAARNILVGENLVCKISDFGLANDVYRYGIIKNRVERLVPFKWISPERMMGGKVPITSKSDVWSFGNLMYEMVTLGCMPHPGVSAEDLLDKLKGGYRMERPSTCSVQLYSIMSKCWKWKDWSRPSFSQLGKLLEVAAKRAKDEGSLEFVEVNGNTRL